MSKEQLKFNWHIEKKLTSRCFLWKSDVKKIELHGFTKHSDIYASAYYYSGINGPNTAYASFCLDIRLGNQYWLRKHFRGRNAWLKARAWCDWLLNNAPNYCETSVSLGI